MGYPLMTTRRTKLPSYLISLSLKDLGAVHLSALMPPKLTVIPRILPPPQTEAKPKCLTLTGTQATKKATPAQEKKTK